MKLNFFNFMDINISDNERVVRLILSIIVMALGLTLGSIWVLILGLILFITAVTGKCLVYKLLKMSTKGDDKEGNVKI